MAYGISRRRFDRESLSAIDRSPYIFIKAGSKPHKPIAIWVVVVEQRVFVRSWSFKPQGWNMVLRYDPRAVIQIGKRKIAVHAVRTRSHRLMDSIGRAYLRKYGKGGMARFARDLGRPKSRATTTELLPLPKRGSKWGASGPAPKA